MSDAVSVYSIDAATGALASVDSFGLLATPRGLAVSRDGLTVVVTLLGLKCIFMLSFDPNTGALFQHPAPEVLPTGNEPARIAVLDANGDGFTDYAVTNFASNTISLFGGNDEGPRVVSATLATCTGPFDIVAADLTGNGREDLVVSCLVANDVQVLLNTGGSFASGISISGPPAEDKCSGPAT